MLNLLRTNSLCRTTVVGSIALLTLPALAGTPKAMTLVPGDSEVVVIVPDLGELLGDIDTMNVMLGALGKMEVTMVTSMIRGMPGINLEGSAAVVLDMADDWEGEPDAVILLPVTSFDDLSQGREAVNGLVEFPMGSDPIYFRDIGGGYAAMSNDTGILSAFVPASNSMEQARAMLGTAGNRVAGANDVMVYLNLDAVRPMLEETFAELEEQGDMVEMMGGAQAAQGFDTFIELYKTAVADGQMVVSGMSFDAGTGFAFDFGLQFKDGSDSAALFNNDGRADSFFSNVPDMDFFYAQAFDLGGAGIQKMFDGYFAMIEEFDSSGMIQGMDISNMMKQFKGGAMVVGASDIMGMTGLLANSVMYTEGESADEALASMQKLYGSMGEMEGLDEAGVTIEASFADEPVDVNGIKAYAHSMSFDIDQGAMGGGGFGAPDPAMMLQVIYGPSRGPSGYAAKAGDGLVFTFSKDADLLRTAYEAAANGKGTMMGNKSLAAASALLPDNRVMEAYLGIEQLLNTAGPMLMMFGLIPEFEPLSGLTPLAFGGTADGGGVMFRTVVPLDTVKAVMDMVPEEAFEMLGGGGDDDWDEDEDDDDSMEF